MKLDTFGRYNFMSQSKISEFEVFTLKLEKFYKLFLKLTQAELEPTNLVICERPPYPSDSHNERNPLSKEEGGLEA